MFFLLPSLTSSEIGSMGFYLFIFPPFLITFYIFAHLKQRTNKWPNLTLAQHLVVAACTQVGCW